MITRCPDQHTGAPLSCFAARSSTASRRFDHVQRDELDSLAALLAPDFVFVSDGYGGDSLVMMRSTGLPFTFSSGKYTRCVRGSTDTVCACGMKKLPS